MPLFSLFSAYSMVWVSTPSGHGSNDTKIRRLTVTELTSGDGITHATSAANGSTFTINRPGLLLIERGDFSSVGAAAYGVSINSNQLTTSYQTITDAHKAGYSFSPTSPVDFPFIIAVAVVAGDVVRGHDLNTLPNSTAKTSFMRLTLLEF